MAEDEAPLDLDRVVDEIRAAVDAKTASGEYSAALDDELRSRVAAVRARGPAGVPASEASDAIERVARAAVADPARIDTSSSRPSVPIAHRVLGKVVSRQVEGLAEQFNQFGAELVPALQSIVRLAEQAGDQGALVHEMDAVQDRVAAVERLVHQLRGTLDEIVDRQLSLDARLDRLERPDAGR